MKITTTTPIQQTTGFCDIIDITAKIQQQIDREGTQHGLATIFRLSFEAAFGTGSSFWIVTTGHAPGARVQLIGEIR